MAHQLAEIKDNIRGEKFWSLADMIYSPVNTTGIKDYNQLTNTFDKNKLKDVNIVYCHTIYLKELLKEIVNVKNNKFIVISHNSDVNVDDSFHLPENILYLFTQNVDTLNNKIISLPIGLENVKWFPEIKKIEKIENKLKEEKRRKNLLYINHSIRTNPKERQEPYDLFKNNDWVSLELGKNGVNFVSYLDNIYNHDFVLCPEGNGIDTHRTWECMYLNTIPIEKRNKNNIQFQEKGLPILLIDSWSDITKEFLLEKKEEFNKSFNKNVLYFDYWKELIINKRNG